VKIIVGTFWGHQGGVDGIGTDPQYLDIFVPAGVKNILNKYLPPGLCLCI
jgi:hypothetical protein